MRKVARKVWKLLLFSQLYAPIKTGLYRDSTRRLGRCGARPSIFVLFSFFSSGDHEESDVVSGISRREEYYFFGFGNQYVEWM